MEDDPTGIWRHIDIVSESLIICEVTKRTHLVFFFHVLFYCVWFFFVSLNLCIRLRLPSPSRHVHHYQNCSITNWKCCQSCFLFAPFATLGSVDELLKIVHFSFSSGFFFTCSSERVLLIFVVRNYSTSLSAISPKRWRSSLFGAEK